MGQDSYHQLIADWKKLSENTFWHYFFEELEDKRLKNLEYLGACSDDESTLRKLQGQNDIYKSIRLFPEKLAKELQEKINITG